MCVTVVCVTYGAWLIMYILVSGLRWNEDTGTFAGSGMESVVLLYFDMALAYERMILPLYAGAVDLTLFS